MKKHIIITLAIYIIFLSGCSPEITENNNTGNYTGSLYKENYIWGGAMNLAWNELNDNILHEKLKLETDDPAANKMTDKFNNAVFSTEDLDEESYYIKSGYGQETVDTINKESREKFPAKTFSDLSITLEPKDIISYAYFLKEVEYAVEFAKKDVQFNKNNVKGFYANDWRQKENISVINYWNDNKFIIALKLKNEGDQLILAKGFDMTSPQDMVDTVNGFRINNNDFINGIDLFEMPEIHLDYQRVYQEIVNKLLANSEFDGYAIKKMIEKIKFDMDYKGARVENEAFIAGSGAVIPAKKPKVRKFILDQPFWVIMKRENSRNPYFLLGVKNSEIMEHAE